MEMAAVEDADEVALLVLVLSDGRDESFERRRVIRNSWCSGAEAAEGTEGNPRFACRFVLAERYPKAETEERIAAENALFGDIIRVGGGMEDTWENLSAKVVAAMNWAATSEDSPFRGRSPVFKTDSDCWMDIKAVAKLAAHLVEEQKIANADVKEGELPVSFYAGYAMRNNVPKKETRGKYHDKLWKDGNKAYPDYMMGPGYLLSADLVQLVGSKVNQTLPSILEDAMVGWMVSEEGGMTDRNVVMLHSEDMFRTRKAPFCHRNQVLKHASLHMSQIPVFDRNLRENGHPCKLRSSTALTDILT